LLKGVKVAILTISDKGYKGKREDKSGPALEEIVNQNQGEIVYYKVLPDEKELIKKELKEIADSGLADLALTTGGTGFSPRDVTPEATKEVLEREAPGLAEAMRAESLKKTPTAMLSRALAGIRKKTVIINLPGSVKGAVENFEVVLPALKHGIEILKGEGEECGN